MHAIVPHQRRKAKEMACYSCIISIKPSCDHMGGKVESTPDKDTIARRINSRNCEWLCRPHIAISELADTAHETMVQIANSPLVDKDALEVMLPTYAKLTKNLTPFERKDANVPTTKNANAVIKALVEPNCLDQFMEKAFEFAEH